MSEIIPDNLTYATYAKEWMPKLGSEVDEVKREIESVGVFVRQREWRIFTFTTITILPAQGAPGYEVNVDCDYCLSAVTPDIETAVVLSHVFQSTIEGLFHGAGWPWFISDRLKGRKNDAQED